MIAPITLSETNATQANTDFDDALKNVPATLILVIGNNALAKEAIQRISDSINSDDHFYKGVRVVHAPKIDYILDTLKGLHVSPRLEAIDWTAVNSYVFLSITNVFNNISNVVLASKYDTQPNYNTEQSIMLALAYDKNLNE
ncbi:hypothetical protein [uncultured Dokdonia sp.]|uniref:hypothetical protein n=1 Tax=uncultured Dokdonia sp. TaxID=575653 RepID=UPI00262D2C1B|nr:hypothetical protein [uncultured Dokdonia sp.]